MSSACKWLYVADERNKLDQLFCQVPSEVPVAQFLYSTCLVYYKSIEYYQHEHMEKGLLPPLEGASFKCVISHHLVASVHSSHNLFVHVDSLQLHDRFLGDRIGLSCGHWVSSMCSCQDSNLFPIHKPQVIEVTIGQSVDWAVTFFQFVCQVLGWAIFPVYPHCGTSQCPMVFQVAEEVRTRIKFVDEQSPAFVKVWSNETIHDSKLLHYRKAWAPLSPICLVCRVCTPWTWGDLSRLPWLHQWQYSWQRIRLFWNYSSISQWIAGFWIYDHKLNPLWRVAIRYWINEKRRVLCKTCPLAWQSRRSVACTPCPCSNSPRDSLSLSVPLQWWAQEMPTFHLLSCPPTGKNQTLVTGVSKQGSGQHIDSFRSPCCRQSHL